MINFCWALADTDVHMHGAHVPHIRPGGVRDGAPGLRVNHRAAVEVRDARHAIRHRQVQGHLPPPGAAHPGRHAQQRGCHQGKVQPRLPPHGSLRWGPTQQRGHRGLCGKVPQRHHPSGLRPHRILRGWGLHRLLGREPPLRHGGASLPFHRGHDRRP